MKNLLKTLTKFADTEFGDNLLCTLILCGAFYIAYKVLWVLYFMGVL